MKLGKGNKVTNCKEKIDMLREKNIDKRDLLLIKELAIDGRKTLVELSKKLKVTHVAIRKRLAKLIREGCIKIQANVNIRKLNLKVLYVFIRTKDIHSALRDLMKLSKKCSCILQVGTLTSNYNLLVVLVGKEYDELRSVVERRLRNISGVSEMSVVLGDIIFPEYLPLNSLALCNVSCSKCKFFNLYKRGCPAPLRTRR
ncbi:MAG: hypothetical protein DRZ82_05230 [Thermoprotei archaeon]|nr:MAG: hypothetical protein DRZ82_05230 [Thermoprotei archaeon]